MLLLAARGLVCHAQDMINHDTVHVSNCRNSMGTLTFMLSDSTVDAWATVDGAGQPITLVISGYMNLFYPGNYDIKVWDGDTTGGILLFSTHYTDNVPQDSVVVPSGNATIQISGNGFPVGFYFSIIWRTPQTASYCTSPPNGFFVANTTSHSVDIAWESNGQQIMVVIEDDTTYHYSDTIHVGGLEANTHYSVDICSVLERDHPCCHTHLDFYTDPIPYLGCPDLTDLHANFVRGEYNSNIGMNIGIVDSEATPGFNRHMVCTDTNQRDPETAYQLRTVFPGSTRSVRLGNSRCGAENESLSYHLHIDTTYYALLLLHYAVVLQNPDHSLSHQPHFRLEILDSNSHVIDPTCGTADFTASTSLGWNDNNGTLWKDWTTIGFDLTPYHGQNIIVRFSTRDCAEGGHFGYAYFNAECRIKSATAEYCASPDSNTMTAPDGFYYLWYFDDPSDTVSTNQTVHFSNTDALLNCRLISTENPDCWVTLNTYAGYRWPLAIIDTLYTESLGCDGHRVFFTNLSTVTDNNGNSTGEPCETALWYFGDNYISSNYSASHIYRDSGDYTVSLIAGIAGDQCRDTTTFNIHIPDYYISADKDTFACDTFWIEGIAYLHDTLGPKYRVHHPDDCDTLYTLHLNVLHSLQTLLATDTFCYLDTYTWHGQTVGAGNEAITTPARHRLVDTLVATNRCDSVVILPLVQMPPPPLDIDYRPDCSHHTYTLIATTDLPYLRWSSDPPDSVIDGHETDNPLVVEPLGITTYYLMADLTDSFACPALDSIGLQPVSFPSARLSVSPEALTYDTPMLTAHDISRLQVGRHWLLVPYPAADTLLLTETSPTITYPVMGLDIDSITVILAIGDDHTCSDTTSQTVPFIRSTLWVPNIFTPDRDDNNRFAFVATGLTLSELSIYNRQGLLVYRTTDPATGWDGTHDGRPCPQGAYVWFLRYQTDTFPGVWQTATGTVTLVR